MCFFFGETFRNCWRLSRASCHSPIDGQISWQILRFPERLFYRCRGGLFWSLTIVCNNYPQMSAGLTGVFKEALQPYDTCFDGTVAFM